MSRVRIVVAAACLATGMSVSLVIPSLQAQSASGVVISEFRVRGPNGGNDEFIELFNNSTAPVDIGGWKIQGSNVSGSVSQRLLIAANTVLRQGCHFLATNTNAGGPYSGSVPGDQTYGTGVTDDGGIALTRADGTIVDQVGLSAGSAYKEGTPLATLGGANLNRSYERNPGTTTTYVDSNNNAADFTLRVPSNPQSRAQCSTDPSGVGTALPGAVDPGGSTILSVRVTPGTLPPSTGLAVAVDLTSIGGLNPQQLYDDGTHGDAIAADNTFSLSTTVADDTPAGSKIMGVAIMDDQGRTGATTIRVDVQAQQVTPIHDIQGAGLISPFENQQMTTRGVVTALRTNGFFIQTPDADVDADVETSEGIFIFTSTAPGTALRQYVQVSGRVQEFRPGGAGTPPVTEISGNPSIALLGSNFALPSASELLPAFTTPDGGLEQLERFEGMRVTGNFDVVSPTASFSLSATQERNADPGTSRGEFYVVIRGVPRPFREPGLEPGQVLPAGTTACCVPRFDGNPERLRVLGDGQVGAAKLDVAAGQALNGFTGVMDYGFNSWTMLPDPGTHVPLAAATPVAAPSEGEFTIGSFNMERFFDTVNDADVDDVALTGAAFERRLSKASLTIRQVLLMPDVLGVVEIENLATLQAIANRVNVDARAETGITPGYSAYLVEGNDVGGIDVGVLVKSTRVNVVGITQVGKDATYTEPGGTESLLNDRPPLVLEADVIGPIGERYRVTVIVNHLRSLSGIDDPADGARVRAKRRAQAEFLAHYIQARQMANPGERIVSVGDYNAFQFSDGYVDGIGTIRGVPTDADHVVLPSEDLVDPDLTDLVELAPASERYSFLFGGNPQLLDHVLATGPMRKRFSRLAFGRSNADFPEVFRGFADRPERLSDHDAPIAYFAFPSAPLVTLNGPAEMTIEAFTGKYTEAGATAADSDGPWPVQIDGTADVNHPGNYTIVYSATNGYLTTSVQRHVHVVDSVKPAITGFALTPNQIWPANHKLVEVLARYEVSDASAAAVCTLGVVSNEPADGRGDGDTAVDAMVIDAHVLQLRAERTGGGSGRTYTASLTCVDPSGNVATAAALVRVSK